MSTRPTEVLPLGAPGLRALSERVTDVADPSFRREAARLSETLGAFRAAHGFGRAISAPQIGVARRFIGLHLEGAPRLVINPVVTWKSDETFTMWDDCMSFPWLLVRVRRHRSMTIRYLDEGGDEHEWARLPIDASELLQHEIDHLDGVLAIDRAIDREAIISRDAYSASPALFRAQVDYMIEPLAPAGMP